MGLVIITGLYPGCLIVGAKEPLGNAAGKVLEYPGADVGQFPERVKAGYAPQNTSPAAAGAREFRVILRPVRVLTRLDRQH